jgi:uncharacterized protein YndB with AHSA1/START domain
LYKQTLEEAAEDGTMTDALALAQRYHEAWTTGDYTLALSLLSPELDVEVPINNYPTTGAFGEALIRTAEMSERIEMLSQMQRGDEAMLLYDMTLSGAGAGAGTVRIVEHFTVVRDRIVRLRQIHDTMPFRAPAAGTTTGRIADEGDAVDTGYERQLVLDAAPDRLFTALTTLDGLTGWWASTAEGVTTTGGEFRLYFAGLTETITMRVQAAEPSCVVWTCLRHTGLPDWDGTRLFFTWDERADGDTVLQFRHEGLTPELDCFEQCRAGWDHFLSSLATYLAGRGGTPYSAAD